MAMSGYLECLSEYLRESPLDHPLLAWEGADPHDPLYFDAVRAIASGDMTSLRAILEQGIDVNARLMIILWSFISPDNSTGHGPSEFQPDSFSLLQAAAKRNQVEMIQVLLEQGAHVNAAGGLGRTALLDTVAAGHLEAARCLLEAGAEPNVGASHNTCNETMLKICLTGWLDNMIPEDQQVPDDLDTRAKVLELLLDFGADVGYVYGLCRPSIHYAVLYNRIDIARQLQRRGAACNDTLRYFVQGAGSAQLLDFLVESDADGVGDAVRHICDYNNEQLDALYLVLERFPGFIGSLDSRNTFCAAATRGDINVLKFLLQKGLDINGVGEDGQPPLACAVFRSRLESVRWLLENGANVNQAVEEPGYEFQTVSVVGFTPLHFAMFTWLPSIVNTLVKAGADVNARSTTGITPLIYLCLQNRRGPTTDDRGDWLIELDTLLLAGAEISATYNNGQTPLHALASAAWWRGESQAKLARALLQRGADAYTPDNEGRLPIHAALVRTTGTVNDPIVRVLQEHMSDYYYVTRIIMKHCWN